MIGRTRSLLTPTSPQTRTSTPHAANGIPETTLLRRELALPRHGLPPLDVIAIENVVVAQDIAVVPDTLDDGGGLSTRINRVPGTFGHQKPLVQIISLQINALSLNTSLVHLPSRAP
jgi:hypothetical protein